MSRYQHRKQKKRKGSVLLPAITLLLFCAFCFAFCRAQKQADREEIVGAGSSEHADHSSEYLVHQGEKYPVIRPLTAVLLIGTDNFSEDEIRIAEDAGARRNYDQSDFLAILVFDHGRKTVTPLMLNRDTVCEIPWLDTRGRVGGYRAEHLAFAHTYGGGKEDSCVNTVAAVRRLLYNAPVEHYLAFAMDAVPLMNDLVGGVTVRLHQNMTELGADYVRGAQITLTGTAALDYVRYREHMGGSNFFRMQRHIDYLSAFLPAARETVRKNPNFAADAFSRMDPYLCTDLTVNGISDLVNWLCDYEIRDAIMPSVTLVEGEKFYEAYVEEDSLWSCVFEAYCEKEREEGS